jgi:predicted MarR family transcription regulator
LEEGASQSCGPASNAKSMRIAEIELATINTNHAFDRWIVHCMKATGLKDLTVIDILVLHHINHRARNKRLADICFILNIEDTHIAAYSIRKLLAAGLISSARSGKDVAYTTTALGQDYLHRYMKIRERCLLDALEVLNFNKFALEELAQYLRKMSGLYDQAARAVSSL